MLCDYVETKIDIMRIVYKVHVVPTPVDVGATSNHEVVD